VLEIRVRLLGLAMEERIHGAIRRAPAIASASIVAGL